ncbi:hypothetical protein ACFLU9_00465 [Chloroflexota bacterium]
MLKKRRYLFLCLTLACFLGLVTIFIVDGYMGIYDTLYITSGEQEQEIKPDFWLREDRFWSTGANWGDKVFFRYEVDNRQFSSYEADIEAAIWRSQEKVQDLLSQRISLAGFDKGELGWVMDTAELAPGNINPEQRYEYTVVVKSGEIERRIIVRMNYVPKPPVVVPSR